jgi:uncharacterized protein
MTTPDSTAHRTATLPALLIAVGLFAGGWVLGAEIKETRLGDRYVTVKGLAERDVKSDLAIWTLGYKNAGDDLTALYAKTEADKKAVLQFLGQQGLQSSEIELGVVQVTDTQANEFGVGNRPVRRYIAQQEITARTSRVDVIAAGSQKTMQLLQQGVVLNTNGAQGLSYKFTGLNAIKPDMIADATRNARAAADRFASDSGNKVGSIRQANQGIISILPANSSGGNDEAEGGNANDNSSLMKTVRVVSSIQYYLKK